MAYPILYAAEKCNDGAAEYLSDDAKSVEVRAGAFAFDAAITLTFIVVGILGAIGSISAAPALSLLTIGVGLSVFHTLIAIKYHCQRATDPFIKLRETQWQS